MAVAKEEKKKVEKTKKDKVTKEDYTLEEIKKMNIYEKMSCIANEIATVTKNLNVEISKNNSYKAVSERDILDAVKPIENKYRIYSYPINRKIIKDEILTQETQYGQKNNIFMRLEVAYEFVNIDNTEETMYMKSYADGIDTGDKAPGKAMTYADKYALMKAYKISTGDDPDKEPSAENGYTIEKATSRQLEVIKYYYTGASLSKLLEVNKIEKLEDLSKSKAGELIGKLKKMEVQKSE